MRLGVHPSTLRRWADRGDVLVVLTPGGHRRFPPSEIERLTSGARAVLVPGPALWTTLENQALTHTRAELAGSAEEGWMVRMDEADRAVQRELGRRTMGLMMQYVAASDQDDYLLGEARSLGQVYAKMSMRTGLCLSQTLQAMMFFRQNVVEAIVVLPEAERARLPARERLLRRVNTFLNAVLLGATESYEVAGSRSDQ